VGEDIAGIVVLVIVLGIFAAISGPIIGRALTRRLELEKEAREAADRQERERRENTPEKLKERQEQERRTAEAKALREKEESRKRHIEFLANWLKQERAKPEVNAGLSLYNAVPRHPSEDSTELIATTEDGEDYVFFTSTVDRKDRKVTFHVHWDMRKSNVDRVRIRKHYKMLPDHTTCAKVGDLIVDEAAHSFTKTEYLAPNERAFFFVQIVLQRAHNEVAAHRALLEALHADSPTDLQKALAKDCERVMVSSFYVTADLSQGSILEANADSKTKIAQFKAIEKSFAEDIAEINADPDLTEDAKERAREAAAEMKETQLVRLFSREG
jgi:hypothetical protein